MSPVPRTALRVLAEIHRSGGIRPAARSLGVSHTRLSQDLKSLETELGVTLLDRTSGTPVLVWTEAG